MTTCSRRLMLENQPDAALHNLIQVSDNLYSGAEPAGDKAFERLESLGVTTIISVDGARPDVEAARRHGMRYVHVPFGYDGVPRESATRIARAMRESDGPVYVHCHHGRHRGPAGAAIAWCVAENRSGEDAVAILEKAGTSPHYEGLWRDVRTFNPEDLRGAPEPELHEIAPVGSFAQQMASLDRTWDNINLIREAGWQQPPEHPDISPQNEALILHEAFVELHRFREEDRPDDMHTWMGESAQQTKALHEALRDIKKDAAEEAFQQVRQSCKQCHVGYRD